MRPASTITVTVTETSAPATESYTTVTETSTPVLTISVYPIPATSLANKTSTYTPPYQNASSSLASSTVVPSPVYFNTSITYVMTYTSTYTTMRIINTTTEYPIGPEVTGVPGVPIHMTASQSAASFTGSAINGSITGWPLLSNAGSLRPPRFFGLLTKALSLSGLVNAQSTLPYIPDGNEPEGLADVCAMGEDVPNDCPNSSETSGGIVSRFYPYPAPLNSGPPPHLTNTVRDVSDNNTSSMVGVPGTLIVTSTVVQTVVATTPFSSTSAPSPKGETVLPPPISEISSFVATSSDIASLSALVSDISTKEHPNATSTVVAATPVTSNLTTTVDVATHSTAPSSSTSLLSSDHSVTILFTVTETPVSAIVSTTETILSHITETDKEYTTSTFIKTVSQTFPAFTGGVAPSATSFAARLGFSIGCVMLAVGLALVIGA